MNQERLFKWLDFEYSRSSLKDENYLKRGGPSTNSTWSILKIARFVGPSVYYVLIKKMESVTGSTSSTHRTKPYLP